MSQCDNEDLRWTIRDKITEIAHTLPTGTMTQEMIDLFMEMEDLISKAFVPVDDDEG